MNWKSLVGKVAPLLGTALGGPFGGMAGKFLAEKLGVEEAELEHTIVNANPDIMFKIKQLDHDFELEMAKLGLNKEELAVKDRADARNMAINTTLMPQMVLATVYVISFSVIMYLVFSGKAQLEGVMKDMGLYLLGILSAGLLQIMNFFYGSSTGSKEKTLQQANTH